VNFTGIDRVLHRHHPRSSPVNFTEFPRFLAIVNIDERRFKESGIVHLHYRVRTA
jgi:hypothetical protein